MSPALFLALALLDGGGDPAFPIKPSPDGRYLVDRNGKPFFYHADTAWGLAKTPTLREAEDYLDDRKSKGFTAVHLHAVAKERGSAANREGDEPFAPAGDITRPNERYWARLEKVLQAARSRGFLVAVSALWLRWGGRDADGWRSQLRTEEEAHAYGTFLGRRFKGLDNVLWILGGDANPAEKTDMIRRLATGIRAEAPQHLLTYQAAPDHASARVLPEEKWLDFNFAYTLGPSHTHVLGEWKRPVAPRPIIFGGGAQEKDHNAGSFRVRQQAYRAILSGALGGHAFGHRGVSSFEGDWRAELQSAGARQMGILKGVFATRPWYALVPDEGHLTLVAGSGEGEAAAAVAARTEDGRFAAVYVPSPRKLTLDLGRFAAPVTLTWVDPTDGRARPAEGAPFPNAGKRQFDAPSRNAAGETDSVLLLEVK